MVSHPIQSSSPSSLSLTLASPPLGMTTLPRMDPTELKRVFQMFDKNGNSRITKKELNDSLENLRIFIADRDLTAMIDKVYVNDDGCVDIDKFGALYQSLMDDRL